MQLQINSTSAGMRLPNSQSDPAAAVGLPHAQPTAAHDGPTAAAAAPQLGHGSPAAESAMQGISSAAVLEGIDSAGKETTVPADLTGLLASPAHGSKDMQGLVPVGQSAMQPAEATDKPAMDVQHDKGPFMTSLAHEAPGVTSLSQAGEPVRGLADPNKRLLAKMGSHAPSDVSKQLLQEVAARSHVQGLLQVSRAPLPLDWFADDRPDVQGKTLPAVCYTSC